MFTLFFIKTKTNVIHIKNRRVFVFLFFNGALCRVPHTLQGLVLIFRYIVKRNSLYISLFVLSFNNDVHFIVFFVTPSSTAVCVVLVCSLTLANAGRSTPRTRIYPPYV